MSTVINLFDVKAKKEQEAAPEEPIDKSVATPEDWAAIMAANKAKKEREEKDRAKSNRATLRSYRLKT